MTRKDIIGRLERCVSDAGSQAKAAKRLKVSAPYLSDIIAGRREPGTKILDALGLKRIVQYEEAR